MTYKLFIKSIGALSILAAMFGCKKVEIPTTFYKIEGVVFNIDSAPVGPNIEVKLEVFGKAGVFGNENDEDYTMKTYTNDTGYFVFYVKKLRLNRKYSSINISVALGDSYNTTAHSDYLPINESLIVNLVTSPPLGQVILKPKFQIFETDTIFFTVSSEIISANTKRPDVACVVASGLSYPLRFKKDIVAQERISFLWSKDWESFKRTALAYKNGDKSDEILSHVDHCVITGSPVVDTLVIDGKP